MKLSKNQLAVAALVLSAAVVGTLGISQVQAHEGTFRDNLAQQLAERFGLNQDEVDTFLEEHHQVMHEAKQEERQARFQEALDNSSLSNEQKAALQAKHEEMQAQREELSDMTPEARREAMAQHRQEMQTWAQENGIDLSQIMGPGMGRGFGGGRHGFNK